MVPAPRQGHRMHRGRIGCCQVSGQLQRSKGLQQGHQRSIARQAQVYHPLRHMAAATGYDLAAEVADDRQDQGGDEHLRLLLQ